MPSRAIVRAASRAALTNPYARAGYMAYKYGPTALRAATKIAKWGYRRFRRSRKRRRTNPNVGKRARTKFGERIGTSVAKRVLPTGQTPNFDLYDTRTQYRFSCLTLSQGTALDERLRFIIQARGVKISFYCKNFSSNNLFFNIAVVTRKDNPSLMPSTEKWWRSNMQVRGFDFDVANAPMTFHHASINTDRYMIHKHKRYTLNALTSSNGSSSWVHRKFYIKLNRQIEYENVPDGNTTEPTQDNLYLIWWADREDATINSAPLIDQFRFGHRTVFYFREPKN